MFSACTSTTWQIFRCRMRPHPSVHHRLIIHHSSSLHFIKNKKKGRRRRRGRRKREKQRRRRALDQVVAMAVRAVTVLLAVISTAALSLSSPTPIFSSISASPSSLPSFPPAISPAPELPPPSLSPDINPELPTPGAGSGVAGSPSSNDLPTIPSTLSPPNPDDVASPELDLASSPASSPAKMSSSAVRLVGLTSLPLLVFCFFIALLLHVQLV